jgi:hypothetical protein
VPDHHVTRAQQNIHVPHNINDGIVVYGLLKQTFDATVSDVSLELVTYEMALAHLQCCSAIYDVFKALQDNRTLRLIPRTFDMNITDFRWVFELKCHVDRSIEGVQGSVSGQKFSATSRY